MRRGTPCEVADCRRMRADTQQTSSSAGSAASRARAGRGLLGTVLVWLALVLAGCAAGPRPDYPRTASTASEPIHDNRRSVTVVPTWAAVDSTGSWQFTLRIWASKARTAEIPEWVVRKLTGDLDGLDPAEKQLLAERVADFLADDDSLEEVTFRFVGDPANELFRFEDRTDFNGIVEQSFSLPVARAQEIARKQGASDGWLTIEAGYRDVKGQGRIKLLAPSGRSVVSDIEDTIRTTEILKGRATVLRNTFLKTFEAVPGMRDRYAAYGDGVDFHYVSGGPWQLYRVLAQYPRTASTAFQDHASTRLGRFFGPAAEEHPDLSGFSLMSQGREAFITRLALADLAERSLDMQYYIWDGDTTGRIILDHVLKAADRGVRVRLLIDDPYYKANDAVIAALDAHPNVEIRLFNSLTNRSWSALDFITDFGRANRRMHNKLMVADNAAAIVGGRNIGDIYYGVNTTHNYRDLDVLAVGPVVRELSGVFDRYWNSASTVPIGAIVDRAYGFFGSLPTTSSSAPASSASPAY